jgi:hypothetical protein
MNFRFFFGNPMFPGSFCYDLSAAALSRIAAIAAALQLRGDITMHVVTLPNEAFGGCAQHVTSRSGCRCVHGLRQ